MIGTSINQYRITGHVGAGGMGEVFRARDTRLNRDVAVKVLPKDFAIDADRLRRFEREAKTLAALNHPNILTIHDAGVHQGVPYLVSELLEGGTLHEEMAGGAMPVRNAADHALQVAHGLATAHAKGVIHRDLKPKNIFVTKDGLVKILDFGLAKLRENPKSPETTTTRADPETVFETTEAGLVMGTPAYMAPEQARGEPADHRTDIFALGCVLYEMLSGTGAFRRDTPVESMNATLNEEPADLTATHASVPPSLARVVHRCLEKQPDNRFQTAQDLAFAIENAGTASSASLASLPASPTHTYLSPRGLLPWAVAAVCLAGFAFKLLEGEHASRSAGHQTAAAPVRQFELALPIPERNSSRGDYPHPVISPDGCKLAYANAAGLWLRWLDRIAPPRLLIAGENITDPFWSPQSTDVGCFTGRKLYRVPITGGTPMLVGTAPESANGSLAGGAWSGDRIIFTTGMSELLEVPAQGGKVTTALALADGEEDFHNASALPDARGVLFVIHRAVASDTIAVWSPTGQRKMLLQLPGSSLFRPVFGSTGHVLFHRRDESRGIWAFPFSLEKLERTGEPFRVSDVGMEPSVANDGTLAFSLESEDQFASRQLAWVERTGRILDTIGTPTPLPGMRDLRLSPDESRAVVISQSPDGRDLWLVDLTGGGAIPFTRNQERKEFPRWWNDGRTIVFTRQVGSDFQVLGKSADGATPEQLLFDGVGFVSGSGKYLLVSERSANSNRQVLGYVAMTENPRKLVEFPEAFRSIYLPELSPDDHLLAYHSEESGRPEVYLVDFPAFTNKTVVSRGGGRTAQWNPNGTELFYMSGNGRTLMSARLKPDGRTTEGPMKVFDMPESIYGGVDWMSNYDVAKDGSRFLMLQKVQDESAPGRAAKSNLRVVLNWFEGHRDKE